MITANVRYRDDVGEQRDEDEAEAIVIAAWISYVVFRFSA
jgi:hypothetical protein